MTNVKLWNCGNTELLKYGNRRLLKSLVVFIFSYFNICTIAYSFQIDRSAMFDEYWRIWNDDAQRQIDADIEKYRKAGKEPTIVVKAS